MTRVSITEEDVIAFAKVVDSYGLLGTISNYDGNGFGLFWFEVTWENGLVTKHYSYDGVYEDVDYEDRKKKEILNAALNKFSDDELKLLGIKLSAKERLLLKLTPKERKEIENIMKKEQP